MAIFPKILISFPSNHHRHRLHHFLQLTRFLILLVLHGEYLHTSQSLGKDIITLIMVLKAHNFLIQLTVQRGFVTQRKATTYPILVDNYNLSGIRCEFTVASSLANNLRQEIVGILAATYWDMVLREG